eukprot:Tbor_TRINITY_DN6096_c0_g2::TRINITY_DN6096_c0_g2_i1::g.11594::m.11594
MSLSSHSGTFGQKTFMVLLVSLLPIVFSCTASGDKVGGKGISGEGWGEGMEGLDHRYHVTHVLKSKEERLSYIKNLAAAKAEKVRAEKMIHTLQEKKGKETTERKYRLSLNSKISIKVGEFDNITLHAVAWIPTQHLENPNEKFPLVIFPNSWASPDFEYILPAAVLAQKGYVTVGYETRGWYRSGGEIDVAGAKDRADASKVIDFLLSDERVKEWNINTSAV